jgi:hypothetical protein
MSYHPNLTNTRVIDRITKALDYVELYVSPHKANWLSTRVIDQAFGQGQLDLSKWLRNQLLIVVDPHFNYETGKCKSYKRNQDGFVRLKSLVNGPAPQITPKQQSELDSGNFEYKEKSNRLWNPLQNFPKRIKRPLFAKNGYNYNYDICCAAPRLLLQYARKCGLTTETPHMDLYIQDRTFVRNEIAQYTGLTSDQVKFVVNALLHGAIISHDERYSSIITGINGKHSALDKLKENDYITSLREEIKQIWKSIKPHRGQITSNRLSAKHKSKIYRELEELVLREIQRYLVRTNNRGLLEHDGWTCMNAIDINELRSLVRSNTGYELEFDWIIYE